MPDDTQVIPPPPRNRMPTNIRNLLPRLPERGHIKIGGLGEERDAKGGGKYQLPVKYNHFRITTLVRGQDGNFIVDKELHEKLGFGDTPTEIPVRLLYDDPTLNLQTRYACYAGKTLWCSGDGVEASRISAQYGKTAAGEPLKVACPCHRQAPDYAGQDRCKINGRLSVIIDGAGSVGGVWVFRTTSYNSVTGLASSLVLLKHLTGGILANIPFKLVIQPKRVTSPVDGKAQTVYVVSLEFAGDISQLQQMGHQIALDRATTHVSIANIEEEARRLLSLPMPDDAVLPGDDPDDIVAEYYPEQNGDLASAPPRPSREDPVNDDEDDGSAESDATDQNLVMAQDNAEQNGEAQGEGEGIVTWAIIDADGVETEVPQDELLDSITAVFAEAAKRGRDTYNGVGNTNNALVKLLREAGESDLAGQIVQAWHDAKPAEPAEPMMGGDSAAPAKAKATAKAKAKDAEPETAQPERAPFWATDNYLIATPLRQDRSVNIQLLRDVLMNLSEQARTKAELAKFIDDNATRIRALREASKSYHATVEATFKAVEQRLPEGGNASG